MPRLRIDLDGLTATALSIVDELGYEALSLSAVAQQLGVGPSALYRHVDGVDGLQRLVALESTRRLTEQVRNAAIGNAGDDALHAVAIAYRTFARDHPARFAATVRVNEPGPDLDAAAEELDGVFTLVYRAGGMDDHAARRAGRGAHSAIHGWLVLQRPASAAPSSDEDDFVHLVETLCRALGR